MLITPEIPREAALQLYCDMVVCGVCHCLLLAAVISQEIQRVTLQGVVLT